MYHERPKRHIHLTKCVINGTKSTFDSKLPPKIIVLHLQIDPGPLCPQNVKLYENKQIKHPPPTPSSNMKQ